MIPRTLFALLASCFLAAGNAALADDAPWTALFNGKDLTGWVPVHEVTFQVVDGNLHLAKGMGWLRTAKEYQDFVLEFEFRALVPNYDSGLFFRCGTEGTPWPDGGWQVNIKYNQLGSLIKGSKIVLPADSDPAPVNKWTKVRLEARGKKAVLFIDGEKGWETELIDVPSGYIGLQAEDRAFDFRNIRIQEVK